MGKLWLIVAPSGVGKTSIVERLTQEQESLGLKIGRAVTATTRSRRDSEVDGVDYYFHTKESFLSMEASGGLLEYAVFAENYYGTPKASVEKVLSGGSDCLLVIDSQGAVEISKSGIDCVWVQLLPPTITELRDRLVKRGDAESSISSRLLHLHSELERAALADVIIVNESLDDAVIELSSVMKAGDQFQIELGAAQLIDQLLEEVSESSSS